MNLLIVSATKFELDFLFKEYEFSFDEKKKLYFYENKKNKITILITGVGIAFTVYKLTLILISSVKKYDLVINAGIAGSFNKSLKLGQVVNITQDEFADVAIEDSNESLQTIFEAGFNNRNEFPFTEGIIYNSVQFKGVSGLFSATAITVNTTHGSAKSISLYREKFKADIESMEGAAVFYVCKNESIPVLQIRSISNYVEPRNKENWKIKEAIMSLSQVLLAFIKSYKD